MAQDNFQPCFEIVLEEERKAPITTTEPINLGVSLSALQTWFGSNRVATAQDVRDLTPATVAPIYYRAFWRAIHADWLPAGIDLAVFDMAINNGPLAAGRTLQEALGVPQDGLVGPVTLNAALAAPVGALIDKLTTLRMAVEIGADRASAIRSAALVIAMQKAPA